jgi:DNA polymerase III subunit alpha
VFVVRGRVDHKNRGETSLVVAEATSFEPDADEVAAARRAAAKPEPFVIRLDAARLDALLLGDLKAMFGVFPGECEVLLEMQTREGTRCLRFGSGYRIDPSPAFRAELDQLLGARAIAA